MIYFQGTFTIEMQKEILQAEAHNIKWNSSFFFFFNPFMLQLNVSVSLKDQAFNAKTVVMHCEVFNIYQSKDEDKYRSKVEKVMVEGIHGILLYSFYTVYELVYYYLKEIQMLIIFRSTIKILHKMYSLTINTQNRILSNTHFFPKMTRKELQRCKVQME